MYLKSHFGDISSILCCNKEPRDTTLFARKEIPSFEEVKKGFQIWNTLELGWRIVRFQRQSKRPASSTNMN